MTVERTVVPGTTVMLTRRCVCRSYLFRPDAQTRENFLYCLGYAAQKYNIELHAGVLMSTHLHVVFTDPDGIYPKFLQEFHRLLANCTKVHRGWGHEVFDASGSHILDLVTEAAIVDKMAYVIANPVDCGAVRYARDWPGFLTRPRDIGRRSFVVSRPEGYFDDEGSMPDQVTVRFVLPRRLIDARREDGAREHIAHRTAQLERAAHAKVREKGHRFLGVDRVLRTSPYRRATAHEVFGAMRPNFSTRGGTRKDYDDEVARRRAFHTAYREAWTRFCEGERDVCFPYGTWLMHVQFGVRVDDPPH